MDLVVGDVLIARLWRWDADRLLKDAQTSYLDEVAAGENSPLFSISVFGMKIGGPLTDEEEDKRALCALIERSARWVTFTTERRLNEAGFDVRLSEPPPNHYDVLLGVELDRSQTERLSVVLSEHERRRFPSCLS